MTSKEDLTDDVLLKIIFFFKLLKSKADYFSKKVPTFIIYTVFENHRKSLIQHCERSELRLHFEWTKVNWKCQKWSILASFWKPEASGLTVLPDRSFLIRQKLVENAKIKKFKCDILSNFQTNVWRYRFKVFNHGNLQILQGC